MCCAGVDENVCGCGDAVDSCEVVLGLAMQSWHLWFQ